MLNKELEKFKTLYSEYISYMVEIHNTYQAFSAKPSYRSHRKFKSCLLHSKKLHKELQVHCDAALKEEIASQDPSKPISNSTRARILRQKELNIKIVNMLESEPYRHGMYPRIAREAGVTEKRIRWTHEKLQVYKQVLFNDKQK